MRSVLAILLTFLVTSTAGAQVTVRGDAAAWQEVTAAFERLGRLRSYRMKITTPGQPASTVIEVVMPDRFRTVIQAEGATIESIVVGRETRFRITGEGMPAVWQCQGRPPQTGGEPQTDLKSVRGEVTISRLADAVIEGARTRGYQYSYTVGGQTTKQRFYVLVDGGLPRRAEILGSGDRVESTTDYYDFNVPITIELPRCG